MLALVVQAPPGSTLISSQTVVGFQVPNGPTYPFGVVALVNVTKPDLVLDNITGPIQEVNFTAYNETLFAFTVGAALGELNASSVSVDAWFYNSTGHAFAAVFYVPSPTNITLWSTPNATSTNSTSSTVAEFPASALAALSFLAVATVAVVARVRTRDVK